MIKTFFICLEPESRIELIDYGAALEVPHTLSEGCILGIELAQREIGRSNVADTLGTFYKALGVDGASHMVSLSPV